MAITKLKLTFDRFLEEYPKGFPELVLTVAQVVRVVSAAPL